MITDEHGQDASRRPLPGEISKQCGCLFVLLNEQPEWFIKCTEHSNAVSLQVRIITRNIAQQVLEGK